MRRTALLAIAILLALPLAAQAHDAECPASMATLTVRVLDGGLYVHPDGVFSESNGHPGLQQGALPEGCQPDARLA